MDRIIEISIIFFILVGGLIIVRESIGYPVFVTCLTINAWGAIVLNQLEKLNGD